MGVVASATGVLRLDASDVDRGVDQAGQALGRLTNITGQSYYGLRNLAMGFELVGDAAAAVITTSAAAATNWEAGMARIETSTFGGSAAIKQHSADVAQLNDQFMAIAENTPVPIKAIQGVGDEVAKLGVNYRDIAPDTQVILGLNKATGTSFDTLTTGVGKSTQALGLGSDGIRRFGSDLFELQRQTPATTEDILTLTQRISGAGAAAGLSMQDILGISAAIASTGGNVRTNASAIQRFIDVMITDMQNGGAASKEFARIAGKSAQDFAQEWASSPGQALAQVIAGLGHLNQTQGEGQRVLQALGFTQATQIDSLLKIAAAQQNASGSSLALQNTLGLSNTAWAQGNALQGATQTLYGTTSAQLQLLKNNVDLAGVAFMSTFLPGIRFGATALADLAAGIQVIPGPLRDAVGVFLGLVAVVGTVGGALLFVIPRFIQARDSVIALAQSHTEEAVAAGEAASAQEVMSESTQILIGLTQELLATQLVLVGEYETLPEAVAAVEASLAGYITEVEAVTVANEAAAESMTFMEASAALLSDALGPVGLISIAIMGAITLLGGGLAALGAAHRSAADSARDQTQADQSLISALDQEAQGVKGATDQWIIHQLAMNGSLDLMQKLGISTADAIKIIKGTADPKVINEFADALQNSAAGGSEWASKMASDVQKVIVTYQRSVEASKALTTAEKDEGNAAGDAGSQIDGLNGKVETAAQLADKAAQAGQQYAQAMLSQASAAQSVQRARDQLEQATDDLKNKELILADAEGKVTLSQQQQIKAENDLADAPVSKAHAAEDQARKLADAQNSLEQAQLGQRQANQAVADAQQRLNQLMDPKESANKLRDAYKELRDAQEALHKGQETVEDAQWQINYLMAEGASRRDLQDAQDALTDAQNNVADATDKAADAQSKIDDLRQGSPDAANQLADAELALEAAHLQAQDAASRVAQEEENVAKAQMDAANNKEVIDAQVALQQAQNNVTQTALATQRQIEALHQIQSGSVEREYAAAQLGLETALYQQAAASVEVQRQHDAMHGVFWTSQQYTERLGNALITMGNQAGGPVGTDLRNMGEQVRSAGTHMDNLNNSTKGATGALGTVGPNSDAAVNALKRAEPEIQHHESVWASLWDTIKKVGSSMKDVGLAIVHGISSSVINALPFAGGGIVTRPTISLVGEAGPEMILPLNDPERMQQLINQAQASGLLSPQMQANSFSPPAPIMTGTGSTSISSTEVHHEYGDFTPTIISNADPDDMMREWEFRNQRITRQPVGVK